jgi:hypothetical protein
LIAVGTVVISVEFGRQGDSRASTDILQPSAGQEAVELPLPVDDGTASGATCAGGESFSCAAAS